MSPDTRHPRDRYVTIYGRKPVLEALLDESLHIAKVVCAHGANGRTLDEIIEIAQQRDVPIEWANESHVIKLSRNGKQHQGVVADVDAPRMMQLSDWLEADVPTGATVLVLDHVSNPANVGMIVRSAVAAGVDGIVLARRGSPDIDPTVIKSSAGVAFSAAILRCPSAAEGVKLLRDHAFTTVGLDADTDTTIYTELPYGRIAIVVGNESDGLSAEVSALVDERRCIPMSDAVESLNVACAASVVLFELARRRAN